MTFHIPIREVAQIILPVGSREDGALAMMSAYFDDSGTHRGSAVIVTAGLVGTVDQWAALEKAWAVELSAPICGLKDPIPYFHMTECQASRGHFRGWNRTETDYFCKRLQDIILDACLYGYGFGCEVSQWDALIKGDIRDIIGNAEHYSIRNCFVRSVGWAQNQSPPPDDMTFVFDDRPQIKRDTDIVYDVFKRQAEPPPDITGLAYLSAQKTIPLQAADIIAWEFYQAARSVLLRENSRRPQFDRFVSKMRFDTQIADRAGIEKVLDYFSGQNAEVIEAMANHFRTFNPRSFED